MQKLGIELPENADFEEITNKHSPYTFTVNMKIQGSHLLNGSLQCAYYEDGTVKNVTNRIVTYDKVKEIEMISEETAYNEILAGHFQYGEAYMGKLESIVIKDIEVQYVLDSKGYFVPVYAFSAEINQHETTIYIRAIKNL